MDTVDRISELPDFILHSILSILDTQEAGRASVLSKRWYLAWSSIPVLDFRPHYFTTDQCLVDFVDKTMLRYSTHKYRITKMDLTLHMDYEKLKPLLDKWIMIAVQNQIQKLDIEILTPPEEDGSQYMLPEILFCAKSLKYLRSWNVGLPYYETMNLISLEHLDLFSEDVVDEDMLQRIISFCPLVELEIAYNYLENISLPWMRKNTMGDEGRGAGTIQSDFQVSPLQKFVYNSYFRDNPWPWNMNMVALKNLRKLEIKFAPVTGDIVSELAYGLVALESLVLNSCSMLKYIKISSVSLKELRIVENLYLNDLTKVTIDAPHLLEFLYNCRVETDLSLIRALDQCNSQFVPLVEETITTDWLVELKKFLIDTKCFTSLVLNLYSSHQIGVEEEQLNVVTDPPYKLRELNLSETGALYFTESSLVAYLDGLFWCCHPDVLSISTSLQNPAAKLIFNILEKKARCWKDPLKSVEVEDVEFPRVLSYSFKLEIRLRLSW